MTSTKYIKPLELAQARKKEIGEQTRSNVLKILSGVKQPLMVREITYLYAEEFGRKFDETYIRTILLNLVDDGLLHSRYETSDEAITRNNGRAVRGSHSALYFFVPANRHVIRTAASIDGRKLTGANKSKKSKSKRAKKSKSTPARLVTSKVQTGTLESMLRERAAELESELEAIYRLLKK